jgi:hypothetical protein
VTLAPSAPSAAQAPRGAEGSCPDRGASRPDPINSWHVSTAAELVGLLALAASALYFLSDVIEARQGGFSDRQLWLTLVAEAAVPILMVGLAVVQRPRLGRLGELAALAYAYAFVVFAGSVVYALVNDTKDYDALTHELGAVMTVHGAVMVVGGLGFGYAVTRARLLPVWTGVALMVGVVLVALAQGLPEGAQLVAAGVRDLSFAGMGVALLRAPPVDRTATASRSAAGAVAIPGVYLYWLPLGAGAHLVKISGRAFESVSAHLQRRPRRDLYHSALEVVSTDGRFVIEMTPIPHRGERERGVVAEGTVGTTWARQFRVFRYEIRRWRDGVIADRSSAISSPVRVANDDAVAQRILDHVPLVPTPVWGRDELHAGEMWNSNSVTAWLLASSGVDTDGIHPPANGRAPGWDAGLVIASEMTRARAGTMSKV